jgi:hypothetical protein
VMRSKRVIVNQDWEVDEGARTLSVKGRALYSFLETCSDLANNETALMACGIPKICRESGLSRSTVIRCLAIARRHRFIIDTGERLPAPYDTIVYKMEWRVFAMLAKGYLDTFYGSVEEIMSDLGFNEETARLLHFQQDILAVMHQKAEWQKRRVSDEELIEAAQGYWEPRKECVPESSHETKLASRRAAFMKVAAMLMLPDRDEILTMEEQGLHACDIVNEAALDLQESEEKEIALTARMRAG